MVLNRFFWQSPLPLPLFCLIQFYWSEKGNKPPLIFWSTIPGAFLFDFSFEIG